MRSRLGECLVQAGLIDERDLRGAIREHERSGDRLGTVLTRMRLATEEQIADALAAQLGFSYFDFTRRPLEPDIVRLIPRELAVRAACIAVGVEDDALVVAMADPLLFSLVQDLEAQSGRRIKEVVGTQSAILAAIESCYPGTTADEGAPAPSRATHGETNDVMREILNLVADAESVDVHIEPTEDALIVRAPNDGALATVASYPIAAHEEVIARLKLMAGLDVSERLLPQAGRVQVGADPPVAVRLSTLRTAYGEKVVIRPVDRRKPVPSLEELGLSSTALVQLRDALDATRSVIMLAGPRGSGRTTSLAAILAELASRGRTVVSIGPVIDYAIPGVTQIPTDDAVGLSARTALAGALAQTPDVVAIDDLEDPADAGAAVRAAVGGRTVIVVLAADDAAEASATLRALVPDREPLAVVLRLVVGQRLVRRLCTTCRREQALSPAELQTLNIASADLLGAPIYEPVGCDQCAFTGYRGRVGLFEVMRISEEMRGLLRGEASVHELRAAARASGMVTLADEGRGRVEGGATSLAELSRAVPDLRDARSICAQCGTAVSPDFSACPHCGTPLGGACPHCGRALQRGWNFCPFCARSAEQAVRPSKRGIMRLVRNPDPPDTV